MPSGRTRWRNSGRLTEPRTGHPVSSDQKAHSVVVAVGGDVEAHLVDDALVLPAASASATAARRGRSCTKQKTKPPGERSTT